MSSGLFCKSSSQTGSASERIDAGLYRWEQLEGAVEKLSFGNALLKAIGCLWATASTWSGAYRSARETSHSPACR